MVTVFLALLAAHASALSPATQRPTALVTHRDYPAAAWRQNQEGAIFFSVFVDPAGKVVRCKVDQVVGFDFGEAVCRKLKRGGFFPAKDAQGKRSHGYVRGATIFRLPGQDVIKLGPLSLPADYSFSMAPGLADKPVRLAVVSQVDEEGKLVDCVVNEKGNPSLFDFACAQLKAHWRADPQVDDHGTARSYVRSFLVMLEPAGVTP